MNSFFFFIISLLLTQSLAQNVYGFPRKDNIVTKYVGKFLDQLLGELTTKNLSIAELDLRPGVGRISNLEGSISGGVTKELDGYKGFGFRLNMTLSKIILKGQYDIRHLEIPKLFPVFGKGNALITTEAINLNMLLDAKRDFVKDKFDINLPLFVISVRNSSVKFSNLMNDPALTDFLNELLSGLIPDLVSMLTEPLLEASKPYVEHFGNSIIQCIMNEMHRLEECIKELLEKQQS